MLAAVGASCCEVANMQVTACVLFDGAHAIWRLVTSEPLITTKSIGVTSYELLA
jgi:hypothetical protein